jgi:hypothetical protein
MRESKGGLTHEGILRLTWRRFGVYLDAFGWMGREGGSDQDRADNARADLKAKGNEPRLAEHKKQLIEETKRDKANWMKFAPGAPAPNGAVATDLFEVE